MVKRIKQTNLVQTSERNRSPIMSDKLKEDHPRSNSHFYRFKCFTYRHKDPCQCSTVWAVQATTRKRLYRCRRQATPTVRSWRNIDRFRQKHWNSIKKFSSYKKKKKRKLSSIHGWETSQRCYLTARTRCHRSSSSLVKLYRRTASPEPRL